MFALENLVHISVWLVIFASTMEINSQSANIGVFFPVDKKYDFFVLSPSP